MKLFLIDKTTNINIIKSQLLTPLEFFNHSNFIVLAPKKLRISINNFKIKGRIIFYGSILSKYIVIIFLKSIHQIYSRSLFEFLWLYFIKIIFQKKWNILFDFRGLASEESYEKAGNTVKFKMLRKLERFTFFKADKLQTVSNSFRDYLIRKYNTEKDITVIPCCVRDATLVEKPAYKTGDKLSFVYVGGLSKWQKFEHVLDIYRNISKQFKTDFTIITAEKEKAQLMVKEKEVKASVISLDQKDIANELKKYDFGFLFRDDILLNNVASPIKFLEYTSNGVIPIISKNVGDYSREVLSKGVGVLYSENTNNLITDIIKIKLDPTIQMKLHNMSQDYTWEKYLDRLEY